MLVPGVVVAASRREPKTFAVQFQKEKEKPMSTILVWTVTLASAGLFILCDSLSANWAKTASLSSLAMVSVLSSVAYLLFGYLAGRLNLAVAGSLINLIIMIGAVLVGVLYFKEHLRLQQWAGIGLGAAAIVILSSGVKK